MRKIILVFSFVFCGFAYAQLKDSAKIKQNQSTLQNSTSFEDYEKVDKGAIFLNGGIAGFREQIIQHIDVSNIEGSGKITTSVTFVVEKNGSISNIQATGDNQTFNKEVTAALSYVKGKWTPAMKYGQEVRSRYTLPLSMNFE